MLNKLSVVAGIGGQFVLAERTETEKRVWNSLSRTTVLHIVSNGENHAW